jgi:hypothetical protein
MFELRNMTSLNIHQRRITLHNPLIHQRLHAELVTLHTRQTLKISARKHQRPEILVNRFQQCFRTRMMQSRRVCVLISAIPVHANVVAQHAFTSRAERFDGEDVAFFHALSAAGGDEGDLFVAVDFVA